MNDKEELVRLRELEREVLLGGQAGAFARLWRKSSRQRDDYKTALEARGRASGLFLRAALSSDQEIANFFVALNEGMHEELGFGYTDDVTQFEATELRGALHVASQTALGMEIEQ